MRICNAAKECRSLKCLHALPHVETRYCSSDTIQCGYDCEARCVDVPEKEEKGGEPKQ